MADRITYVGLDVHKEGIVVAVAAGRRRGEVREYGRIANAPTALDRLLRKLGVDGVSMRFCHEAGPCGYGIQRQVSTTGHECVALADPQGSGRQGQDRPAGCCQPGQAAPGRRADGGGFRMLGTRRCVNWRGGTARRRSQPAPSASAAFRISAAARMPLWPAGLDQAVSPLAGRSQVRAGVHHLVLEDYIAAVEAAEARTISPGSLRS
jgi:transposase